MDHVCPVPPFLFGFSALPCTVRFPISTPLAPAPPPRELGDWLAVRLAGSLVGCLGMGCMRHGGLRLRLINPSPSPSAVRQRAWPGPPRLGRSGVWHVLRGMGYSYTWLGGMRASSGGGGMLVVQLGGVVYCRCGSGCGCGGEFCPDEEGSYSISDRAGDEMDEMDQMGRYHTCLCIGQRWGISIKNRKLGSEEVERSFCVFFLFEILVLPDGGRCTSG